MISNYMSDKFGVDQKGKTREDNNDLRFDQDSDEEEKNLEQIEETDEKEHFMDVIETRKGKNRQASSSFNEELLKNQKRTESTKGKQKAFLLSPGNNNNHKKNIPTSQLITKRDLQNDTDKQNNLDGG